MTKKSAVYPGFFDPFTMGHLDVVTRATDVFEEVVVAVAKDSPKASWFTFTERFEMVQQIFRNQKNIKVDSFDGLLIEYMKKTNQTVLLRGLRTVSDFEYEFQMALANKTLDEKVETLFMMTNSKFSYLSSTLIREIARLGGNVQSMVPPTVGESIARKKKNP